MPNVEVNNSILKTKSVYFPTSFAHYLLLQGFECSFHDDSSSSYRFTKEGYTISVSLATLTAYHKAEQESRMCEIASSYMPTNLVNFAHWLAAFAIVPFSQKIILKLTA